MDPTTLPLFATPGTLELAVILLIAVLLFGANKIPKLARSTGQAMGEFQRGREEIEQELQEIQESDTETTTAGGAESSPTSASDETDESTSSESSDDETEE